MNRIFIRSLGWAAALIGSLVLVFAFALACTYVYLAPSLPTAETMHRAQMAVPLRVYARSGGLISQIGEERRIPVTFEEIPLLVQQAVLAAEDDRFFEHRGFEWKGIVRAILMNAVTADAGQGGSTITQQAARNMFLTLDKTLRRKLSEVFITWRMERDFTKEQILSVYLTKIYFGQRSYGIAAAAETYYGRRLNELTVAQAATLAGIIQLPSRQNPIASPNAAQARRSYVLRRMTQLGYIDQATAEAAGKEPVVSRGFAPLNDVDAAYVAELARQDLVSRFGEGAVNAGYKVYTTLDSRLQTAANRALRLGLMDYDRRRGYRGHLGKVELPANADDDTLDDLLNGFRSVAMLEPAVVTAVSDTAAEVHVRRRGPATIRWEGLSWARRTVRGGTAAAPRKAGDVVQPGDVVHVITDGRGNALLAQVPEVQGALVALDPQDGAIVSLVGGFDFFSNQFNRATQARRQPGSGIKPFLYSAALDAGHTPASIFMDMPIMMTTGNMEENWRPQNSSREFSGPMRLREALVRSRNLVSIRILQDIGVSRFIEHAERFGFNPDDMPRNDTLALGTQTTTPLQMARGYAVFANGGFRVDPYFIDRIEDADGKVVYEAQPLLACTACEGPASTAGEAQVATVVAEGDGRDFLEQDSPAGIDSLNGFQDVPPALSRFPPAVMAAAVGNPEAAFLPPARPLFGMDNVPDEMRELASVQGGPGLLPEARLAPRVLSAQNAWLMSDIMHDVTVRGTAARTNALNRDDLAGKTGTNEDRDNWFNGFNANLVASVWIGNDDFKPLGAGAEGSTTAVPLWMYYMREALKGTPSSRPPRPSNGLVSLRISPYTGTLAVPGDPEAIVETFMVEHLPPVGDGGYLSGEDGGGASRGEPLF